MPQISEAFPAPVDPASSRCVPRSRINHGVPSSHRPIGSAEKSARAGTANAGTGTARASLRTNSSTRLPARASRMRHNSAPNPWARLSAT